MRKLIDQLMKFDFTESEAKVYLALLRYGAGTGYEAANNSGVARSKVYEILNTLTRRGAVVVSMGEKNKKYSAVSMETLTDLLDRRNRENLEELSTLGESFGKFEEDESVWELSDRDAILTKALQVIRETREELLVQIWAADLTPEIEHALWEAEQRDIRFACILYDGSGRYETKLKKVYRHGFEEDKMRENKARWMTLVADKKCMIHMSVAGSGQVQAFFTLNKAMTFFAQEYVMHDAYCLRLIEQLEENVQDTFGQDMEGLRDIFTFPK